MGRAVGENEETIGSRRSPRSEQDLTAALAEFAEENRWVREWEVYPDVDEETDEAMPACETMSREFATFLRSKGFGDVTVIEADDPEHPDAGYHRWTRIVVAGKPVNVDWTARQFWNLDWPPSPQHQHLPTPLVWEGDGGYHPVTPFGSTVVVAD